MADVRIVSGGQNEGPITAASVRALTRANALLVALVNISGDIVNPGGGGGVGSDINLNQIGGVTPAVGAGASNTGTLRVILASDQASLPVTGTFTTSPPPVTGVQIVGGGVGGTVGISGDSPFTIGKITAPVSVTGDVSTTPKAGQIWPVREQGPIGVQVLNPGGRVSISGDQLNVNLTGSTAPLSVTGDVSTKPAAGNTWPVREQAVTGVQIVGGGTARVSISGDNLGVTQTGAWATAITGDVSTLPKAGQVWPVREQAVTGVQVVGGAISVTGDTSVKPSTTNFAKFPVSGDTRIMDGSDPTITATVKSYARSKPLAVVLVNASGDAYAGYDQPNIVSVAGRVNAAGSAAIVAAVPGKRIKVFSYALQGDGDNARGFFANGASGSPLTLEWELASREGLVKQVGSENAQFLFATTAGAALSFESSSSKPMKYEISYQADDPT